MRTELSRFLNVSRGKRGQVRKCGQSPMRLSIFRGSLSTSQTDIEIADHLIDCTFPYSSRNWTRLGNRGRDVVGGRLAFGGCRDEDLPGHARGRRVLRTVQ